MKTIIALLKGFNLKHRRVVNYVWLGNLTLGIIGSAILYGFLSAYRSGFSAVPELRLPPLIIRLIDLVSQEPLSLRMLVTTLVVLAIYAMVLHLFLSAGSLAAIISSETANMRTLLALSARHFWKIARIFFFNLLLATILIVIQGGLGWALFHLVFNQHNGAPVIITAIIWLFLSLVMLTFFLGVYDYSRIFALKFDRGALYSCREALRFWWTHKWSLLVIFSAYFLAVMVLGSLANLAFVYLDPVIPVLLSFLVFQLIIWLRQFLKIWLFSGEIIFLDTIITHSPETE